MKKYAFFDIDGTIYNGNTCADLMELLVEQGIIKAGVMDSIEEVFARFRNKEIEYQEAVDLGMKMYGQALAGLDVSKINLAIERNAVREHKIFPYIYPVIEYLHENQFQVILISAAIEPCVKAVSDILQAESYYFTESIIENGIYTGETGRILHSFDKHEIVKSYLDQGECFSIAFGDSTGDLDMLKNVDIPFLIQPHQEDLIKIAKENNWFIAEKADIYDGDKVIEVLKKLSSL